MEGEERISVVTPKDRKAGPTTLGMDRQEAFATDAVWAGSIHTDPGMVSDWHHHGAYETVLYVLTGSLRMEFGPRGSMTVEARPGDSSSCPKVSCTARATPPQSQPT
jgi:uncharacterized RmlC-like cupin family protein